MYLIGSEYKNQSLYDGIYLYDAKHNGGQRTADNETIDKSIYDDEDVKSYFTMVRHIWRWFEKIRCVLRVSREFSGKEQNSSANGCC